MHNFNRIKTVDSEENKVQDVNLVDTSHMVEGKMFSCSLDNK